MRPSGCCGPSVFRLNSTCAVVINGAPAEGTITLCLSITSNLYIHSSMTSDDIRKSFTSALFGFCFLDHSLQTKDLVRFENPSYF